MAYKCCCLRSLEWEHLHWLCWCEDSVSPAQDGARAVLDGFAVWFEGDFVPNWSIDSSSDHRIESWVHSAIGREVVAMLDMEFSLFWAETHHRRCCCTASQCCYASIPPTHHQQHPHQLRICRHVNDVFAWYWECRWSMNLSRSIDSSDSVLEARSNSELPLKCLFPRIYICWRVEEIERDKQNFISDGIFAKNFLDVAENIIRYLVEDWKWRNFIIQSCLFRWWNLASSEKLSMLFKNILSFSKCLLGTFLLWIVTVPGIRWWR